MKILVETSARHVHLSEEDLITLFGEGASLTPKKPLSQPGQYACEERVTIVGPRNSIANVVILGPTRKETQVEVSATDARTLGVVAVVKESGDIKNTPGCRLVGPVGEVVLKDGVIVAKRHIHATPEDAKRLGISDREVVQVKVESEDRSIIFGDVVVRVHENFALAMHIDTDESNSGMVGPGTFGKIV